MLLKIPASEALVSLDTFDTIVDARSESEYAEDHVPGAVNWPSLSDQERAAVGIEYKQQSPFAARKRGAALVARNVAAHIERNVLDRPKDWKPLVYCWRGGQRSGALALVLEQIGFKVTLLDGGYRAWRRAVLAALETLPAAYEFRVVCGTTGSGKSRLLQRLQAMGAQVLDLEALAEHRGSVLGLMPGTRQPGQKEFDSRIWDALRRFDPAQPVFIESESKKVGDLRVPEALVERMRAAPCLRLALPLDARVALLLQEYEHFTRDLDAFCDRLDALRAQCSNATVDRWQEAARAGRLPEVVRELLLEHYDPIYTRSIERNFSGYAEPLLRLEWDGSDVGLEEAAARAAACVMP